MKEELTKILESVEDSDSNEGYLHIGSWNYEELVTKLEECIQNKEKEAFEAGFHSYNDVYTNYDPSTKEFIEIGFKEAWEGYKRKC